MFLIKMRIQKNILWTILIGVLVIVAGLFLLRAEKNGSVINETNENEGQIQVVKLYTEGDNYVLEPSTLKIGIKVRLEGDISRLPGCSRAVVIPEFNVRKNFKTTDNFVEFTPNKAGTFNIMCTMNMYTGTFKVE